MANPLLDHDPYYLQQLRLPVEGDSPLMAAIRDGNTEAIANLLASDEAGLGARNSTGETCLYLALRAGEFALAEALYRRGAPDAEDIVADERFGIVPQPQLALADGPMSDAELDEFFHTRPPSRVLQFENLRRLRGRLAEVVERQYPRAQWRRPLDAGRQAVADAATASLRQTGFAELGQILSAGQIAEIRNFLSTQPIFAAHVPQAADGVPRSFAEIESGSGQGCYHESSALVTPHLLQIATDPSILFAISEYMGCTPTIFTSNVLWSYPHDRPPAAGNTEYMHRDYDDYWFVVLFIYLTDVDIDSGAHRYYLRTHDRDRCCEVLGRRFAPDIAPLVARDLFRSIYDGHHRMTLNEELLGDQIRDVTGPAGTAFLADTYGFHRALPPRKQPRLIAWFRYGIQLFGRGQFQVARDPAFPDCEPYIGRYLPNILVNGRPRPIPIDAAQPGVTESSQAN